MKASNLCVPSHPEVTQKSSRYALTSRPRQEDTAFERCVELQKYFCTEVAWSPVKQPRRGWEMAGKSAQKHEGLSEKPGKILKKDSRNEGFTRKIIHIYLSLSIYICYKHEMFHCHVWLPGKLTMVNPEILTCHHGDIDQPWGFNMV